MDCSPPGSSVHGDSPGKNTGVGCHALLQGIFLTQRPNPSLLSLLHCRQILCPESLRKSINISCCRSVAKSCLILCNPIDGSTSGFPVLHYLPAAAAKSLQPCPTLCDPKDGSPTGSSIPGILQARTLEWIAISFSNAWKWKVKVKSLSHVQLFSLPGSSIHGIFQARVLEWGAIAFSSSALFRIKC